METRNSLLKKALDAAGIAQEKLAQELGVSRATVSERLNKEADIDSVSFILAVCKLTGKEFYDFVDMEEQAPHHNADVVRLKDELNECRRKLITCLEERGKE